MHSSSIYDWETTYPGYQRDASSGLYAVRYRYYHPIVGTWLTREPQTADIVDDAGLVIRLYEFDSGSPLSTVDTYGLEGESSGVPPRLGPPSGEGTNPLQLYTPPIIITPNKPPFKVEAPPQGIGSPYAPGGIKTIYEWEYHRINGSIECVIAPNQKGEIERERSISVSVPLPDKNSGRPTLDNVPRPPKKQGPVLGPPPNRKTPPKPSK
jgi:RHS repeat-associated protein